MNILSKTTHKTMSLLMGLTLLNTVCLAQQPDLVEPVVPVIPNEEVVDNELKAKLLGEKMIPDAIEQPLMTGDLMANLYRELTGKRVLVSKAAAGKQISFVQPGGLTFAEAAELLEQAALLEDLVFLPSVNNPNLVKLVLASNSNKNGVPVIRDSSPLPSGDKVVTYAMVFKHIQPDEALKVFNSIVKGLNPQGSIVSVPNTSSLIITENTALIKTLIEIKSKIDIPQGQSTKKMIDLEHADAEEVVFQIQEILDFSAEQNAVISNSVTANRPANQNPNPNQNSSPDSPSGSNSSASPSASGATNPTKASSNVKVVAITRTNSLWLIGRPIDVEFAESIIKDFDRPIKSRGYFTHKLSYLAVSEFLPVASNAIRRKESGEDSNSSSSSSGSSRPNNNASSGGADGSLADSERLEFPESTLVGKTLLVADNANNSLIVQGPPQSIALIKDLIKEMDVAAEQVQVTAIFGRYNVDEDSDFGVDFATLNGENGIASRNVTGFPILVDPSAIDSTANLPDAVAGLSIYGRIGQSFFPTLRALQNSGKFKLLARPTVFTTNNKKAVISSGQSIAVPTNTLSQGTGVAGNVTQSTNIEFREVLLRLEVIPLVNSEDEVTLQIAFTNENIVGNQLIDGNNIPTIGQEEILTTVTVPNGGTIALGGLITEVDSKSKSGVPILSKIPGLGKLFSSESKEVSREELVVFIQPTIVGSKLDLLQLQEKNQKHSKLARELQAQMTPSNKQEKSYSSKASTQSPRKNRFRSKSRR